MSLSKIINERSCTGIGSIMTNKCLKYFRKWDRNMVISDYNRRNKNPLYLYNTKTLTRKYNKPHLIISCQWTQYFLSGGLTVKLTFKKTLFRSPETLLRVYTVI